MRNVPAEFQQLFDDFARGPTLLRQALVGLDAGSLNQRPAGADWSIRDVVVHLADAELVRAVRIRFALAEADPLLPPFDEEAWKRRLQYLWRDVDAAIALFQQTRYSNAELLSYVGKDGWQRAGIDGDGQPLSVLELTRRGVEHVTDHVGQIESLRAALGR
ncbi:MAG: DinB family protein [Hyphomicrobiales bacterium]